jgi:hypothetical protein
VFQHHGHAGVGVDAGEGVQHNHEPSVARTDFHHMPAEQIADGSQQIARVARALTEINRRE